MAARCTRQELNP